MSLRRKSERLLFMTAERKTTETIASRMLARYGVAFIWEAHVAAAAAYGLGKLAVAEDLTEIAEAAEQLAANQLSDFHELGGKWRAA